MDKYLTKSSSHPSLPTAGEKRRGDSDLEWKSPKRVLSAKQMKPIPPVNTHNKYGHLPIDQSTASGNEQLREASTTRKNRGNVPPIHLQIEADWTHERIKCVVSKYINNFHLRYIGGNKIAVHCYTSESHISLQAGLRSENIAFFTYSRKDERTYKYVIFGLPACVEDHLQDELAGLGFTNVTARRLQSSNSDNLYIPPLLVHLQPRADIAAFQKIKYLSNCAVQIRKFKAKSFYGTQCYRCQLFGHSSKHCNLAPRCVKCTEPHATEDCPKKDRDSPARCCNCKESHPANYRQCKTRQNYLKMITAKKEEQKLVQKAKQLPRSAAYDGRSWAAAVSTSTIHQTKPADTQPAPILAATTTRTSDNTTAEILEILTTIKTLKQQFIACPTTIDKVILIITHLGHCV